MYNRLLDAFIKTAESGSFTKASSSLFLSPTAIMKQVNALEDHLGLRLLERTPSGVALTDAGRSLYNDAKFIISYSEAAIERAREVSSAQKVFRVGTSILNPAKPFVDLYYRLAGAFSDYKLSLIPFEDDHEGIVSEVEKLGAKFDFLVGICDSRTWLSHADFIQLGRYRKMVSVPRGHRLADRKRISVSDLSGETLMMVPEGDSGVNDFLRNDLKRNWPGIHIVDTSQFYDVSVFNKAVEDGAVLLTTECWKNVHPSLVSLEVDWDYSIPYGILFSKRPEEKVLRFAEEARHLLEEENDR